MEALGMLGAAIFPVCLIPIGLVAVLFGVGIFSIPGNPETRSLMKILAACIFAMALSMVLCGVTAWLDWNGVFR